MTSPAVYPAAAVPACAGPPDALGRFVAYETRSWAREPLPVPRGLSVALWVVYLAAAGVGHWLAAVQRGAVSCTEFACSLSTWGHPGPMLALAAACAAPLTGLAVVSRGFTRFSAVTLPMALAAACCGLVAVSGVVALVALVLVITLIGSVALVAVVERV